MKIQDAHAWNQDGKSNVALNAPKDVLVDEYAVLTVVELNVFVFEAVQVLQVLQVHQALNVAQVAEAVQIDQV